MPSIPTNAHIAGTVILNTALNASCFMRIWFMRRRRGRGSAASLASSILYYTCIFISFFQTCTIYYRLSLVKKIENDKTLSPEMKMYKLLTPELLLPGYIELVGFSFDLYLIKGAFVAMYYDLALHLSNAMKWALHCLAVIVIAGFFLTFSISVAWCRPISSNWLGGAASCNALLQLKPVNIMTWYCVGTDVLIALFATALIRSLKLSGRDIWALAIVFLIGFVSIAATVMRYVVVYDWIDDLTGTNPDTVNVVEFWGSLEVVMGAICFTLPTFRALLRSKSTSTTQQSYGYSGKGSKFSASEGGTRLEEEGFARYKGYGGDDTEHELQVQMCNSFEVVSKKASTDSLTPSHHVNIASSGVRRA